MRVMNDFNQLYDKCFIDVTAISITIIYYSRPCVIHRYTHNFQRISILDTDKILTVLDMTQLSCLSAINYRHICEDVK